MAAQRARGAILLEWLVVLVLSMVVIWASFHAMQAMQSGLKDKHAQQELMHCAMAIERLAWVSDSAPAVPSGELGGSEHSSPPCLSDEASVVWVWQRGDGDAFELRRLSASSGDTSPTQCVGWATNEQAVLWRTDPSGEPCE